MSRDVEPGLHEAGSQPMIGSLLALVAALALTFVLAWPAEAAVKTWTGASGGAWNDAANWSPAGVPLNGDILVFDALPHGATRTTTNNIPRPRVFDGVVFLSGGYSVSGGGFGVRRGIFVSPRSGSVVIRCDLTLAPQPTAGRGSPIVPPVLIRVSGLHVRLTLEGGITSLPVGGTLPTLPGGSHTYASLSVDTGLGSTAAFEGRLGNLGALGKTGPGTLILSGQNDFKGPTAVRRGTLEVTSPAALGATTAGTTIFAAGRVLAALPDGSSMGEPLAFAGGTLSVTGGSLTWNGGVTTDGGTVECQADSETWIRAAVAGGGGLTKTGPGRLYLTQASSYAGQTVVNEGTVYVGNAAALGSAAGGTIVRGPATLSLGGYPGAPGSMDVAGESLEVTGSAATVAYYGAVVWRGPLTVHQDASAFIWGRGEAFTTRFELQGSLGGAGSVTFRAVDFNIKTTLAGPAPNWLSGTTTVLDGQLWLEKPADTIAVAGPLEVSGYQPDTAGVAGRVSVGQNGQLGGASQASITMRNGGQLLLNGFKASTGHLFMYGGSIHPGPNGELILWGASILATGGSVDLLCEGSALWVGVLGDGEIEVTGNRQFVVGAAIRNDGDIFSKTGNGRLTLVGDFNQAAVRLMEGIVEANGGRPFGVQLMDPGVLEGAGTVGPVVGIGGSVRPGKHEAVGRLVVGNSQLTNTALHFELNGPNPATEYDQLGVNGTLSLASATLNVTLGFQPAPGSSFVIIANDGTDQTAGTFVGLAEGAELVVPGSVPVRFRISYRGGDGNDVVLTVI